ncbi:hypothetical protein BDP27DRAFT_159525 [Rhodocollybia butyracea]|uniref:DUF3295 domain-containing protein n=1 Tax=Rhodocollybia butyracea TaxID=206335 RepID=A0A9P5PJQ6_9AGAR|nr:hypothetical protein BDP27DRAFT_159525 [Rhodocollybia butyracea]
MNPNPEIFPDNHPYKRNNSDGGRIGGLARMGLQPMTNIPTNGTGPGDISALSSKRPPSISGSGSGVSFSMAPPLRTTKSAVALPITNSVTASSYLGQPSGLSERAKGKQREQAKGDSIGSGPSAGLSRNPASPIYRPKGRPQNTEMEDESEDDPEHALQISHSAAHEKIAALASKSKVKLRAAPPPSPYPDPVPPPQPLRAQSQRVGVPGSNAPPLLGFPYNLPLAAPPSSPRTTRRLMLLKEIPDDLRQNLLWSRKVNKQEFAGPRRSSSSALNMGLQPLTAIPAVVQLTARRRPEPGETSEEPPKAVEPEEEDLDLDPILRPGRMQRNRSWAGGGR